VREASKIEVADRWIADAIVGQTSAWPDALDVDSTLNRASEQGLAALLFGQLSRNERLAHLPARAVERLRREAVRACALELAGKTELQKVCGACAGADALLFKGAALAYDVYSDASWRGRSDVDLLVRPRDRQRAIDRLVALGYRTTTEPLGTRVSHQVQLQRTDEWGCRHVCDLHWTLSNRARFADAVSFDDLLGASIALPRISPEARGLGHEHALWLASVHRIVHHQNDPRAIWLYDVHALAQALDQDGMRRFVSLAARTSTRCLAQATLRMTAALFATTVPDEVWWALDEATDEPARLYLQPGLTHLDMLRDDLAAIDRWSERWALVAEHLFPAESYMRGTFRPHSRAPLAWLYAVRILTGAGKWMGAASPP
jgi:Uncharacterised nucleotidyltransferase